MGSGCSSGNSDQQSAAARWQHGGNGRRRKISANGDRHLAGIKRRQADVASGIARGGGVSGVSISCVHRAQTLASATPPLRTTHSRSCAYRGTANAPCVIFARRSSRASSVFLSRTAHAPLKGGLKSGRFMVASGMAAWTHRISSIASAGGPSAASGRRNIARRAADSSDMRGMASRVSQPADNNEKRI